MKICLPLSIFLLLLAPGSEATRDSVRGSPGGPDSGTGTEPVAEGGTDDGERALVSAEDCHEDAIKEHCGALAFVGVYVAASGCVIAAPACAFIIGVVTAAVGTPCAKRIAECGFKEYNVELCIKTSGSTHAGTNDNLYAQIKTTTGQVSDRWNLDQFWYDDFEKGDFDCYGVPVTFRSPPGSFHVRNVIESVHLDLNGNDGICIEQVEIRGREDGGPWSSHIYWDGDQVADCAGCTGDGGKCFWLDNDSCAGRDEIILSVDHSYWSSDGFALPGTDVCGTDAYVWHASDAANDKNFRTQFRHLGCYKDEGDRALSGMRFDGHHGTPERCMKVCRQNGFKYFGLQWYDECFCGHSGYDRYGEAPLAECDTPCNAFPAVECGGYWRMSVYEII